MSNTFTKKISSKERALADRIIAELELDGFAVDFKSETASLLFKKEFKTVEILLPLVENNRWGDIRHLFRAVLAPSPQHYIYRAENEWSRGEY